MAFLEELGKTISDKGKEAAKKARGLTEVLQLKSQISSEKSKINETYASIGKIYMENHKNGPDDEMYDTLYHSVKEGLAKIAELEKEICQLEGNRVCAECGARVDRFSSYCGQCGALMEDITDKDDLETESEDLSESADSQEPSVLEDAVKEDPLSAYTADSQEIQEETMQDEIVKDEF